MKNILVLSPTFPFPLNLGSKIRIYNIIKQLSADHVVDLAAVSAESVHCKHVSEMKRFCRDVIVCETSNRRYVPFLKTFVSNLPYRVNKFHSKQTQRNIRQFLCHKAYDIIWCNNLNMASYLDKDEFDRDAYVVLDMINEDELTWRTYKENTSSYVKKLFARKNIDNLRRFRSRKQAFFNLVLSVSHREREFTQTWLPRNIETDVVPNGIASEFLEESASSIKEPLRKNILFCGSLDIAMNQEAVRKFTSHVFPKIRRVVAEARFWVIGRNPSVAIRKMSSEQIVVTGSVPDVRPYYRQASVAVAPFEFGGGTKLKIIEALALHVPLVSTSIGVQGIDVVDGHHLLIRDDWDRFAEAVIRLLQDESLGQTLANQGRRLVKERYTWDAIMGEFLRRHSDVFAE